MKRKRTEGASNLTEDRSRLKRLKRSELLEIILMLKENEAELMLENNENKQRLDKMINALEDRKQALKEDNALGAAEAEMERAYVAFQKALSRYHMLLMEQGMKVVGDKTDKRGATLENE